jgi:hypothetical protein
MSASKDRRGKPVLHVPSLPENMGMGRTMKISEPPGTVFLVREAAGRGAGKAASKSTGHEFKTIHKGKNWDGPTPRSTRLAGPYNPKTGSKG